MSSTAREAIASLHKIGLTVPEIARRLALAPTTVSYHVERIVTEPPRRRSPPRVERRQALVLNPTRAEVSRLLAEGISRAEIARRLGVSKATVSYHAARLGKGTNERFARRYDWDAVQRYYDQGHSVRDCMHVFGFSGASWSDAVKRGVLVGRPSATPMSELLVAGTYRGRNNLKLRLIKEGLKANECERCTLTEWLGAPVTLALHHINGDRLDNRLENLELLCPNCHSQTDNFSRRNGRGRQQSP